MEKEYHENCKEQRGKIEIIWKICVFVFCGRGKGDHGIGNGEYIWDIIIKRRKGVVWGNRIERERIVVLYHIDE